MNRDEPNTTRWTGTPSDYGVFWEMGASSATKRGSVSFPLLIPPDTGTRRKSSATRSIASTDDDFWTAFWDAFLKWFCVVCGAALLGVLAAFIVAVRGG